MTEVDLLVQGFKHLQGNDIRVYICCHYISYHQDWLFGIFGPQILYIKDYVYHTCTWCTKNFYCFYLFFANWLFTIHNYLVFFISTAWIQFKKVDFLTSTKGKTLSRLNKDLFAQPYHMITLVKDKCYN